ncbi:MAG: TetR/AcrR family transcriptional regulator [Sphingomonadales bacterium]
MPRNSRNSERTREKILKAAGDVLVIGGVRGFGVNAISALSGYGKPLVYRYFGERGAVLNALVDFKVAKVASVLADQVPPQESQIPANVYRQVMFARVLAGDAVLRALFRALLSDELGSTAARALDGLVPFSGASGDAGAAEAFLLGGISYVLLLRDSQDECAGVSIKTPMDMATFERAFVALSSKI